MRAAREKPHKRAEHTAAAAPPAAASAASEEEGVASGGSAAPPRCTATADFDPRFKLGIDFDETTVTGVVRSMPGDTQHVRVGWECVAANDEPVSSFYDIECALTTARQEFLENGRQLFRLTFDCGEPAAVSPGGSDGPPSDSNQDTAPPPPRAVHPGVTCDRSGMSPIVGPRFHLPGRDYDLCEAEFLKLEADARKAFVRIDRPQATVPKEEVCLWLDDYDDGCNTETKYAVCYGQCEGEVTYNVICGYCCIRCCCSCPPDPVLCAALWVCCPCLCAAHDNDGDALCWRNAWEELQEGQWDEKTGEFYGNYPTRERLKTLIYREFDFECD